jgi:hypothetical protein
VSIASLARYRAALRDFVHGLPAWLEGKTLAEEPGLRAVEGGLL